jgi:hypothetical protein
MATILIKNGAVAGALAGMLSNRNVAALSADPANAENALDANAAAAFAAQFLTANAALAAPMADADNANIFLLTYAAAYAAIAGRGIRSATATDYAAAATGAVAVCKASVAKLS